MDMNVKAQAMANRAIGKEFSIRLQKATRTQSGHVVKGRIVRCEVAPFRSTYSSTIARWYVWLEGRSESFLVSSLPR